MTHHATNESPLSRFANLIFTQSRHRAASAAASVVLGIVGLLLIAAPARAEFGLHNLDLTFTQADGSAATQAGSHPFAITNTLAIDTEEDEVLGIAVPSGDIRDLTASLPPGLVADRNATRQCTAAEFRPAAGGDPICARATVIGTARVELGGQGQFVDALVYNLVPPPGVLARIGFAPLGDAVSVDLGLSQTPPYSGFARLLNAPQAYPIYSSRLTLWGVPADPAHDAERGGPVDGARRPYLTLPRSCTGPLASTFEVSSWQGGAFAETIFSHGDAGEALGMSGCERLSFAPSITAVPTAKAATSPTGLDFSLDVKDENLQSPDGEAASDIERTVVTLPQGMTVNPSQAEGLEVCTEADLEAETIAAAPGEGCPQASKIGTIEVESPLLEDQILRGSLFVAKPYENYADNSLLALYIVIKDRDLSILVKQPARVEPDPVTGQLTTIAEGMPQLPFSHFRLHFREGARSPLTTPQACGTYDAEALLYPWSGAPPVHSISAFQIITGPNEGPCPTEGLPPFKPGLIAGTINNRAGSFSPFNLRLFRSDSEQEITHFSIKLPPGITGKLAGIPYCSDAAIEAAKARTGPHGGQEELDSPSCPAASEIGRTLAGAGVGSALAYAPGKVYLAGPYHGSNLSMVAITAGVVGPFDIGTVVVREGFKINPETAEVFIDSTGSDPIPHIIRGIPVHLRDIRAYVDRPEFVLNPTDCTPTSTASTVLGAGLDFVSEADDNPITVTSRFQAADCAALSFAPRLTFKLIGGTKRGKFPKLTSHLQMNGIGESGIDHASVILPHSEFIENAHFVNICTRVQFKEGAGNGSNCPAGSIYGHARAVTPILSEPLEGPVMLRSNPERKLPDVVAALHNAQVDFDLVGNVDSVKGQLRTTFASAPDAPVTSFDLELEGGSKGLFVNSTDLCLRKHFVQVAFGGQNGKQFTTKPLMHVKCKGKPRKHKRHNRRHHRRGRR